MKSHFPSHWPYCFPQIPPQTKLFYQREICIILETIVDMLILDLNYSCSSRTAMREIKKKYFEGWIDMSAVDYTCMEDAG